MKRCRDGSYKHTQHQNVATGSCNVNTVDKAYQFWLTETHKGGECTRFPLDCPQECGVLEIPREEVESHVRDDCMMTMVVCPYEGAGCSFHDTKSNLKAHLEVSSEEHLNKIWSMLLKTKERLNELEAVEDQNVKLKKDVTELQKQFEEVKQTSAKGQQEISLLNFLLLQAEQDARDREEAEASHQAEEEAQQQEEADHYMKTQARNRSDKSQKHYMKTQARNKPDKSQSPMRKLLRKRLLGGVRQHFTNSKQQDARDREQAEEEGARPQAEEEAQQQDEPEQQAEPLYEGRRRGTEQTRARVL
ncbi:TNF receptor-associated factor 4 [Desmophyllum pertusum]|uniref:TNF receptor-associated factor 4 n=1 Tax=Desmophyllum pertusum TaxID=174260 RepID=A0A9W9YKU2_9CNID|nr:TNF receptor-associated factor 4 [Desmophyllum pertusum]